ncbi:MAG: TaqI-like C-terminal specificity domain-containing protein [Clostridia bacterium]|nr:TaqI-like C-terminal specificity domain-containing protein [Clostridia bacterium]
MLRGKDIKKYNYTYQGLYLITTFPSLKIDIEKYIAIKNYLLSFGKQRLEQSGNTYEIGGNIYKSRKFTHNKWFETQDSINYRDDFYKQKIIYSEIVQEPQFYLDYYHYFPEATTFIMTGENLEIVLACLNSKPYSYAFKKYYSGGGLGEYGYRYKKAFLEKLPLPVISDIALKNKIIELVTLINNSKDNNLIKDIQLKIDNLLYDYIGITKEEKRVINSN